MKIDMPLNKEIKLSLEHQLSGFFFISSETISNVKIVKKNIKPI